MSDKAPKYTLTGNTVAELAKAFAEVLVAAEKITLKDVKNGEGQYLKWELGGGEGIMLENKEFEFNEGIPLFLGMTTVWRKLTPKAEYGNAIVRAKAATIAQIDKLKAKLAGLQKAGS